VNERLLQVARRIRDELDELARVIGRAQEGWLQMQQSSDDLYLDSVALNLHGYYAGLERLFELIAGAVDGTMPQPSGARQGALRGAHAPAVRRL
jgi:hypothetical protein